MPESDGAAVRPRTHPVDATVTVAAPMARVFALLTDADRMPDWMTAHAGWVGGPPGALAEGDTFGQRVTMLGMPAEVSWTVSRLREPGELLLDGAGPMGVGIGCQLTLTREGPDRTTVRYVGGLDGDALSGPAGPIAARALGDSMAESLRRLVVLCAGGLADQPDTAEPAAPTNAPAAPWTAPPARTAGPVHHAPSGTDLDPRTPVIVGVGQLVERDNTVTEGRDPASLAAAALRAAAEDSGAADALLAAVDSVRFVASVSWPYADGAALVAEHLGVHPGETVQTAMFGGDGPLRLLNDTAAAIGRGELEVALIGGAEAAGIAATNPDRDWPRQPDGTTPSRLVGSERPANSEAEVAAGLAVPIYAYSLIESALRGKLGTDPAEHLRRITALWSAFSSVAADNPYAWQPVRHDAERLASTDAHNRAVAGQYSKLLTANLRVNQATGLIVCSAAAAARAGVPPQRWVFPHAGAHAEDEWFVTERADLASSPAIRAAGTAALRHAGLDIADVEHVDLYSCFPVAVQLAAAELGLPTDDPARPLTVTGGLTFGGGPGNNHASHAVATVVDRLRADPDAAGLVTALGWYLTKHAVTVLSGRPPSRAFRDIDAAGYVPRPARRRVAADHTGPAVLEAFTVQHGRDGTPEAVVFTALTPDGDRVVRRVVEPDLLARLTGADPLGWQLAVDPAGVRIVDTDRTSLPAPAEPPVLVEWRGPIAVIRLNRPARRNAVDLATARALESIVDAIDADPVTLVSVLTGNGGSFCAGMDLKSAALGEVPITEKRGVLGMTAMPPTTPMIAAVEGHALAGGCELALVADLIVAAEDSEFGIPEVRRGLVAAAGGVLRLAQRLPRAIALELALTGDAMPAGRMYDLGLVNRVVAPGTALDAALELAARIAANAPISVAVSKEIVDGHRDWRAADEYQRQAELAGRALASADAMEGIRAFAERRDPVWRGR